MEKITVCHVSTLTRWGGVERMLIDFIKHSRSDFIQHVVVSPSSNSEIVEVIRDLGVPFFQPYRSLKYDLFSVLRIARWMKNQEVDIIHSYNLNANIWGGLTTLFVNTKAYVGGEHGTIWFSKPPLKWLERSVYHRANKVIANSEATKKMLIHRHRISHRKIKVIYNGVPKPTKLNNPAALRQSLGVKPGDILIGTVGRLDTSKDMSTLLEAAQIIFKSHEDARLMIVGDGPLDRSLHKQAADLQILEKVIFTGWRKDAREILGVFDIYVSTSVFESFGNTLVEAALQKKPIIAPRIDGIPEVVIDGETGYLLDPSDEITASPIPNSTPLAFEVVHDGEIQKPMAISSKVLAEKIEYLLDRPDMRNKLGQAGYNRALDMFSIDRYVEELESIYQCLFYSKDH